MAASTATSPLGSLGASPASLARVLSQGKWRPASHLARYDVRLQRLAISVGQGGIDRLALQMPPRHGKSLLAKWFIFWHLGLFPDREVIVATASSSLARGYGYFVRQLVDDYGQQLFGLRLRPDRRTVDDFQTPEGGGLRAVGTGSAVMGRGADLLVLDDLYGSTRNIISAAYRETVARWYGQSLYTRLTPDGKILNLGSRQHSDDLWGRQDQAEAAGGDKWTRLIMPCFNGEGGAGEVTALWPERFPLPVLERIRQGFEATGQLRDWQSQYLLQPPQGDGLSEWPASYFEKILADEMPRSGGGGSCGLRVLALDPSKGKDAKQGDYSAWSDVRLDGAGHLWVESDQRIVPTDQVEDVTVEMIRTRRYQAVIVEANGFQEIIARNVLRKCQALGIGCPIYVHVNVVNKVVRIRLGLTPLLAQGRIHLLPGKTRQLLLNQLKFFPFGLHDDGPDSLELATQALNELLQGPAGGTRLVPVQI